MQKLITKSENETIQLGKKLAQKFRGGEIIGLVGELGSGKTILTKGMAQGLSIKKRVTSPTFVLMKIYKTTPSLSPLIRGVRGGSQIKNFIHIDAYRLKSGQDLIDIGIKDWLEKPDTVTVIEWADKIMDILPKNKIIIKLKQDRRKNERIITIKTREHKNTMF